MWALFAGRQPTQRLPVAFINHGGGAWPFTPGLITAAEEASLRAALHAQGQGLNISPKALLVISAHWEEAVPTVMTSAAPPMLYDYSGALTKQL